MSGGSPYASGQDPWSGTHGQPPWAGNAPNAPNAPNASGPDPFSGGMGAPTWGAPGPGGPTGQPPGFHGRPPVHRSGTTWANVRRNCTLRNGHVHDGLAAALVLIALVLPWNRFFSLPTNHQALVALALLLVSLLSLASLALPHLARLGVFGAGWGVAHTRMTRVIMNSPYLAFVIGFLLYDIVRGYVRLGSGAGLVSAGVGVAAWFGVAGAVLAAQPRASELFAGGSHWMTAGRYLLRTGLVLAVGSAVTNVAAVFVSYGLPAGEAVKLLAVVLPAVVTSAAIVGVAVLGLGRDVVTGRLVIGAFAVAALVAGVCLAFGYDTGSASSSVTAGTGAAVPQGSPQPVYTEQPPVLVVLDTSGSMSRMTDSGSTRIEAARTAVDKLIDGLDPDRQFALMSFPGNGPVVAGCSAGELDIPFGTLDSATARSTVARLEPDGETPTGPTLRTAGDLIQRSVGGKGVVVLVSDGEYSCGESPCAVARELANEGLHIQVNTVGFQISNAGGDELQCIAQVTGGQYVPVQDPGQLQAAISDLSASRLQRGAPWLEYFHYDFGGPERLGYLGVLLWVAAAAAMANPAGQPSASQDAVGLAYRWLLAGSRVMLLVAMWNVGSVAVESISAALKLTPLNVGGVVAHVVLSALTAVTAVVAVRALQPRRAPGVDPRPARGLALSLCAGTALLALISAVVRAVAFTGSSVGLLDLTGVWLPAMVAAGIIGAPPVRALYADRPLFAQRRAAFAGYPPRAPGYPPPNAGPSGSGSSDPFAVTYFQPTGPGASDPFSSNVFHPPTPSVSDPFGGGGFASGPPDPFSGAAVAPRASIDPGLTPAELYRLAQSRPDLRVGIAGHPNADPQLLAWLGQLGDPVVARAVSQRLGRR